MSATVGVLLADDSPVFLAAAVTVVTATPGFEVAATCSSGSHAVAFAARLKPDLALLDQSMPGVGAAATADAIAAVSPDTFVVLVSADPQPAGALPLVHKRSLSPPLLLDLWQRRPATAAERNGAPT
jgi:DNA-binding NarL/FixJ family response regulator